MKRPNKKIILILSIFLIFLVMGAASAVSDGENITDDDSVTHDFVKYDGPDAISTESGDENTDTLADEETSDAGSFAELEQYINDNKGYKKTVTLNKDYVFNNETDMDYNVTGVYLGTYVEIDGQGRTIDAQGTNYIFNTLGKHITLKNIVFKNTIYRAINVDSSNVNIINCTFDNNTNRAVGLSTSASECIIDDCTFKNGAGLYTSATGTIIQNCRFINNTNGNGAGINIASTDVVIDNCIFKNNTATSYGGAIYFSFNKGDGVLNIYNSEFIENGAVTGGAIYHYYMDLNNNDYKVNYYMYNNIVNITSSTFKENIAVQFREIYGPYNNNNNDMDGGKYYDPELDALFDGVTGGEVNLTNKTYTLTKGPISLIYTSDLTINGNGAIIDGNGFKTFHLLTASLANLYINNITIKNSNSVNSTIATSGGAVYVYDYYRDTHSNIVQFNETKFINNTAGYDGGALYVRAINDELNFYVYNSHFENNYATQCGGAIGVKTGYVKLRTYESNFTNNSAGDSGGAVYVNSQAFYTRGSNFISNTATTSGAYRTTSKSGQFRNCMFVNNTAFIDPIGVTDFTYKNTCIIENNTLLSDFGQYINTKYGETSIIPHGEYQYNASITLANGIIIDGNGSTVYGNGNVLFKMPSNQFARTDLSNIILVNCSVSGITNLENVTFINCTNPISILTYTNGNLTNVTFINCKGTLIDNQRNSVLYDITVDGVKYDNKELYNYFNLNDDENCLLTKKDYTTLTSYYVQALNSVIDGQNSTISGIYGNKRIFDVMSDNTTIKNFILKNTTDIAITYKNHIVGDSYHSNATIDLITNNSIVNVNFVECCGAISTEGKCTIINSTFSNIINNRAIYCGYNSTVINSSFENINVNKNGNAIYFDMREDIVEYNVENCNFINLTSLTGNGGAIYIVTNAYITNCNFINCTALSGGSIYQSNSYGVVNVSKSSFDGGKAHSTAGAIYVEGTLIIDDCEFNNNTADNCAGFKSSNGLTLTNSNFTHNYATLGGAGSVDGANTVIEGCTFNNNSAMVGGGLNVQGKNLTIKDTTFSNNTATAVSSAVQISGDDCTLNGVTIEGSSAPDGAAILVDGNNANVTGCTFKNNAATDINGSMLTVNGNGTNLEKVNVTGNSGKGITLNGDDATIKDNIIADNDGTAITVNGKTAKVEGTQLSGNNGTAVVVNGDGATFTDNTITGNNGTAMIVNGNGAVLEKTNVTGNDGAGIVINGNGTTFTGNSISGNNGTALTVNGNDAEIAETTISNNDGDGVIVNGEGAKFTDNTVTGNNGTAMTVNGNNATLEKTNVTGNDGAGIVINGNGTKATENTVSGNNGTAMIVNGNDAVLEKTNVTGNDGAGIVINGNGTKATENTVSGNNGTGVVLNGNDVNMTGNNLTDDIVISEDSNMNTPEKKEEIINDNPGVDEIKTESNLNIIVNPSIIHSDENITLNVTMATGAGTVKITINGRTYTLTENGIVDLGQKTAGDYNISIEFTQNTGFTPIESYIIPVHVQNWNFTELQELINNPENGTVNLGNHTFIRQEGESPITVPGDVVVNGEGSTIDANGADNALTINANNTSINDLTINNVNGTAVSGSGDNIKIDGVNINDSNGTAILLTGENATVSNVDLEHVENGIVIEGKGNAIISNVNVTDASGKAIDVTADNVEIENTNLTKVNEGINANATSGNVDIKGVNANNVTTGTAITSTGKNVTVTDTNFTDVVKGVDVTATSGDAKVDNVVVDGADSDAITVKAENGTATVTGSEVKNVENGTAIAATGKDVVVANSSVSNVVNGSGIKADAANGTAKVENTEVDGASGSAIDAKGDNVEIKDTEVSNTGEGIKANATNGSATVDNVTADNIANGPGIDASGKDVVVKDSSVNNAADGIKAEATNGSAVIADNKITGTNGTAVDVNAPNGDANITGTTISNSTGKSINYNATNANVNGTELEGGNVTAPEGNATNKNVEPTKVNPDTAFNIPESTSSTPEYSINLPKDATGDLVVMVDGKEVGRATLKDGQATVKVPELANGQHNVEVKYTGDANYAGVSKNITYNVTRTDLSISAPGQVYVINYGGVYSVTLSSKVAGQKVILNINGQKIEATTDANGVARFNLNKANLVSAGVKTVTISFAGDSTYNPTSVSAKITVNKESTKIAVKSVKKTYKKSKTKKLKITLKNSKNKPLVGKFNVKVKVNKKLKGSIGKKLKKSYTFKVTFKKGIGYITLKNSKVKGFKKGTYKFTVTVKGNSLYNGVAKKNIKMKIK